MRELIIDDKKFVAIPEENFKELQKNAALKWKPEKTFTVEEARVYSKKLINEWASEK
ncbi:hypothetical protein [Dyadobacter sp. CY347]|uniref:hypothetical protein n=1 Tax=Dyadobacter sp. CY347 TaxID=2909336 RepID=UPI001F39900C|nr:hypothetical protein [Dyadobacter sp. CY347]MCF2488750.1 hypothetical protein [Dyadobacter sp. CY347]